ncbi:uncharacterized protein LOC107264651 isoform X2 [Cephus cinctus]|uniref:Uncharacterized protein LOC107264651 isoform X2 n=1 Tax=Cephus cinctus TaxID=211228 RepID=A0AAJ7FF23_CEPCN|nr:uncharacterized protein LOC107264651 isoform X2 [Cephus cinctus]
MSNRSTAASWVKKLREVNAKNAKDSQPIEYLKLLLFVMQKNKLSGIFEKAPPEGDLEPFPQGCTTAADMISLVKSAKSESPPYSSIFNSVSGDLCQYAAVQEIPKFGIHGYYAISTEPLPKWSHPKHFGPKISTAKSKDTRKQSTVAFPTTVTPDNSQAPDACRRRDKNRFTEKQEVNKQVSIEKKGRRREIPVVESRPCWGRSRYIERLIDESPHHVADLDLSQADALLHLYSEKKMRKIDKDSNLPASTPCKISSKRREVERAMDLAVCTEPYDDGKEYHFKKNIKEERVCNPDFNNYPNNMASNNLCGRKTQKMHSRNVLHDAEIEDTTDDLLDRPSSAIVGKTIVRTRGTGRCGDPEVHEKTYLWKNCYEEEPRPLYSSSCEVFPETEDTEAELRRAMGAMLRQSHRQCGNDLETSDIEDARELKLRGTRAKMGCCGKMNPPPKQGCCKKRYIE